jgi:hypothetical protein
VARRKDMFAQTLDNVQDVTEEFDRDLGGLVERVKRELEADAASREEFRSRQVAEGMIRPIPADPALLEWADKLLRAGQVCAVDGTDLLQPLRLYGSTIYGCITAAFDRMRPLELTKKVTFTRSAGGDYLENLRAVAAESEGSWPTTWPAWPSPRPAMPWPTAPTSAAPSRPGTRRCGSSTPTPSASGSSCRR